MWRYSKSEEWLARAENTIPLGSQTFSKSRTQYPVGISPLYLERGKGAYVWDIDGNKYIDLGSALASVTLGYADKSMNAAITRQLKRGISLSLPAKLEAEVAEKLVEIIPSAEMVRFGKNGTDATSAAVRLARAYTGRDVILACGYHGWQDWYIGATSRNKGVPKSVSALTKTFPFNDLDFLRRLVAQFDGKIAAIVLEPMNAVFPLNGFLQEVKNIAHTAGALLIFDETITGFRFSKGGAQELFKVTPDLSTFGKGMANGMPLSAVVGRRDIMMEMEQIFFSGTFGGELLSLAAANYVIDRYINDSVAEKLFEIGGKLSSEVIKLIESLNLQDTLFLTGHETWKFLNWKDSSGYDAHAIKTYFLQEMFLNNILLLSTHNVNASIKENEIELIIRSYGSSLMKLSNVMRSGKLLEELKANPIKPLFTIR